MVDSRSQLKFKELPPEVAPKKVIDPEYKKRMEATTAKIALASGAGYLVLWVICQPLLPHWLFEVIDTALFAAFAVELGVRVMVTGDVLSFLTSKEEWAWNRLELLVLVSAFVAKLTLFLPSLVSPHSIVGHLAIVIGSLRVVRLVYNDRCALTRTYAHSFTLTTHIPHNTAHA